MTTQTSTQKNYFNLHTTGIGYLNDIRLVEHKKEILFMLVVLQLLLANLTHQSTDILI